MQPRALHWLSGRRLLWKTEWLRRLQTEPAVSTMAEPAILAYLMDDTLGKFSERIGRMTTRPARLAAWSDFARHCRCGLNPLLAYFSTGETALKELTAGDALLAEDTRAWLHRQWAALARQEIDALCSACRRTCATPHFPVTVRGAKLKPEPIGAAGRGKSSALRRLCAGKPG
jgi:hypothetical protein